MKRAGIIGLGLMGGSLGMALRKANGGYEVLGFARRAENRARALESGAVDCAFSDVCELAAESDIVICCLPVKAIASALSACVDSMRAGTVLTDVGSTKRTIVSEMRSAMKSSPAEFVGSHPICGSEMEGIDAARADLYQDAITVVTPAKNAGKDAVKAVETLWKSAGSDVIEMDAELHDRLLARSSHLPHLAAALLATVVGRETDDGLAKLCGSGYRDSTRLADGSPKIWRDIVQTNKESIKTELESMCTETAHLLKLIDCEDFGAVESYLENARASRRGMLGEGERQ